MMLQFKNGWFLAWILWLHFRLGKKEFFYGKKTAHNQFWKSIRLNVDSNHVNLFVDLHKCDATLPTSIQFISFWLPITVSLCSFKSIIIATDSSSLWMKTATHKLLQLKHNGYCIWKAEKAEKKTQVKSQCTTEQRKAVKNTFSFKEITGAQIDLYNEFRAFFGAHSNVYNLFAQNSYQREQTAELKITIHQNRWLVITFWSIRKKASEK